MYLVCVCVIDFLFVYMYILFDVYFVTMILWYMYMHVGDFSRKILNVGRYTIIT